MSIAVIDGRARRKQRGVDQMLFAGLGLVRRGNWRPTAKEVCEASGISVRTFFSNFGSVEDFYTELLRHHGASLRDLLPANVGNDMVRIAITGKSVP